MRMIPLLCFLALWPSLSSACPLGPGESKLTLARVMRNFGRLLLAADHAAQKGAQDPTWVSDDELRAAIADLTLAESCAGAAAGDRSGDLYPSKASRLEGEAREQYLQRFWSLMQDFLGTLGHYREIFAAELARPAGERGFAAAKAQKVEVAAAARRAHEALQ